MIPARASLWLAGLWTGLALGAALWPPAMPLWLAAGAALAVVLGLDLTWSYRQPPVQVERLLAHTLALGVSTRARLRLHNPQPRAVAVLVQEDHPPSFALTHLPRLVSVPAQGWAEVVYAVRTSERGQFELGPAYLRQRSPLGMWWRPRRSGEPRQVKVYPNFRAVARYALLAASDRVAELGIRKRRRRGEGTEFHQLREYRFGDSLRQIDWRATSRVRRMISREYRDERDQQLLFLLDCGRRMHARDGALSHLDHALDALLLLAYVALRQGDAVGLATFGGQTRRLPPRKGAGYLNALLNMTYDLNSTTAAADAAVALEDAVKSLRRRTLVVMCSNLRDEQDDDLLAALRLANRRHLVLLASLREVALDEAAKAPPADFSEALRFAATHDYLRARREAHERLGHTGLLWLDVTPKDLAVSLVNRYLRIKASGEL